MRGIRDNLVDLRPYTLGVLDDVIRPEAQNTPTLALHCRRPPFIGLDLEGVMIAVDFNDEFARYAGEVSKVRADGMLPTEFDAAHPAISQKLPADSLGAAAVSA